MNPVAKYVFAAHTRKPKEVMSHLDMSWNVQGDSLIPSSHLPMYKMNVITNELFERFVITIVFGTFKCHSLRNAVITQDALSVSMGGDGIYAGCAM